MTHVVNLIRRFVEASKARTADQETRRKEQAGRDVDEDGDPEKTVMAEDERLALQLQRQISGMRGATRTTARYEPGATDSRGTSRGAIIGSDESDTETESSSSQMVSV